MIYNIYNIVIEFPMSYIVYMLSIPVVGGGVGGLPVGGGGGGVVGVVGGFPFLMQRILHFPPLEPFLASVTTLMLKSLLTLALKSFPFSLQSLRNNMLHKI